MKINFFESNCKSASNKRKFGLIDPEPAIIDESNEKNWIATIINENEIEANFYALDNCIFPKDEFGGLESLCDGLLKFNKDICFIELKNRAYSGWLSKGREQLTNTLKLFLENESLSDFSNCEFIIANKQRPVFTSNYTIEQQKFKTETNGKLLNIKAKVEIK